MENVIKAFWGYFNTLETHGDIIPVLTYYVESMCFQSDRFHFRYLLTWCGSKLYSNAALLDLVYQTLEKLCIYLGFSFSTEL